MRPARLVLLALVVLGGGAYVYFVERHAPTTEQRAERKDKIFPELDQEKVRRVEIVNSHGRFELEKANGEWKLTAPVADDANSGTVASLLSSLRSLKAERTLEAAGLKLADYGLDPAGLSVTAEDETGVRFTVTVGSELPLGNSRAAMTDGAHVYLVNKYLASDIDRELSGWRSDQLAQLYSSDVASLSLVTPAGRVALAHSAGVWTLTEPFADLADRDRAEGLVSDLNAARIKEFVDAPDGAAALGLAPPRAEVNVVRKDKPPVKLEFGAEREVDGSKQVACRRGERLFWVDGNAAARAVADAADWRSTFLVRVDTWAVQKLEVSSSGSTASLERKDGLWKAGDVEVDGDAVSRRLNVLADLKVVRFDLARPAGAPLGSVKAALSDGSTVEASFFPGATEGERVAAVVGRSGAFGVDAARVSELLADPAALAMLRPTPTPEASETPAPAES